MTPNAQCAVRPGFVRLGGRKGSTRPDTTARPDSERRGSPLPAAARGRYGRPSRRAVPRRRGVPGPASRTTPHHPVPPPHPRPHPALPTPRAIRVHWSPR